MQVKSAKEVSLRSLAPYDLVVVEWIDAHESGDEVTRASNVSDVSVKDALTWTPGWFIKANKQWVLLGHDRYPLEDKEGDLRAVYKIPRGWVRRVWRFAGSTNTQ